MFAFRSKPADRLTLLFFDGTGVVLVAKRLEAGAFCWPNPDDAAIRLTAAEMAALVDGLDWRRVHVPREVAVPRLAGQARRSEGVARRARTCCAPPVMPSESGPSNAAAALQAMLAAERLEHERLRKIIRELQRLRFGRRAESLPHDQLHLGREAAEAADEAVAEAAAPSIRVARVAKRPANWVILPAHLPRIDTVVDNADDRCPCCSTPLHRISEDMFERLDVVPAQFRVLMVRRPKCACRVSTDDLVQAPAPARLIEGGLPTDATVGQVLMSIYADHLPPYRQAQIFARQGVNLDRSALATG